MLQPFYRLDKCFTELRLLFDELGSPEFQGSRVSADGISAVCASANSVANVLVLVERKHDRWHQGITYTNTKSTTIQQGIFAYLSMIGMHNAAMSNGLQIIYYIHFSLENLDIDICLSQLDSVNSSPLATDGDASMCPLKSESRWSMDGRYRATR